jgi:hypothetical protein
MTRFSLALIVALAVGSYSTHGQAQNASEQNATPTHHNGQTHGAKVKQKNSEGVRTHRASARVKAAPPKAIPVGIFEFTC